MAQLNRYTLSCGFVQRITSPANIQLSLWLEHGIYHVRCHNFESHIRLFWESFHTLTAARTRFSQAARMYKMQSAKDTTWMPHVVMLSDKGLTNLMD